MPPLRQYLREDEASGKRKIDGLIRRKPMGASILKRTMPEPGFEPEYKAPQALRISMLPHSGIWATTDLERGNFNHKLFEFIFSG